MRIHALARAPHLMEHLSAIHKHLPDGLRGETADSSHWRAPDHWGRGDIVMVAGFLDIEAAMGRKVIYVEHGAGQTYAGIGSRPGAYYHSGAADWPANVVAYLGPRQACVDAVGLPGFAMGAPICDDYELFAPNKIAVITYHWNGASPAKVGVPEAGTAFEHYEPHHRRIIAALRAEGYTVWGHRHPRFNHLRGYWDRNFGLYECSAAEMRRDASLLICDNSSVAFEHAYLWRRVVSLNAPWYRRGVEHGLRFWTHVPGEQVDDPDELISMILDRPDDCGSVDLRVPEFVYGKAHSDGFDGLRAATWLVSFVGALGTSG